MRVRSETIRVVEYDPHWATLFLRLRERLWPLVSDLAIAIEHVGSTSVPGLAAKPVLDIDIVIRSRQDFPTVTERLASRGYAPRGDLGIADREAFAAPAEEPRHHLVCLFSVQSGLAQSYGATRSPPREPVRCRGVFCGQKVACAAVPRRH